MSSKDKSPGILSRRARKLACRNVRFDVYLDDVESTNGEVVHDYLVVAPRIKTVGGVTGVAVLPIVGERIGLLQIYRHAIEEFSWEIPRGFVDPGETDVKSALRELEEETGLQCDDSHLVSYGLISPEPGVLAANLHLFAALHCTQKRAYSANEIGHGEFRLLTVAEVMSMMDASEIRDPCTLITCLKYFKLNSDASLSS